MSSAAEMTRRVPRRVGRARAVATLFVRGVKGTARWLAGFYDPKNDRAFIPLILGTLGVVLSVLMVGMLAKEWLFPRFNDIGTSWMDAPIRWTVRTAVVSIVLLSPHLVVIARDGVRALVRVVDREAERLTEEANKRDGG